MAQNVVDTSVYYNPNKMMSYNRILNFVIGGRGIGKTYGIKKHIINRAIKKGKLFIYLRRYKSEIRGKLGDFFNDVKAEFPDVKLEVKGRKFYANGKLIGYAMVLSSWQSEKSTAYPDVETIMYDEALREKDNSNYIPNEPQALLNFMDTVFRNRDNVRCVCLSNSVTLVNPYFVYFNIVPDIDRRFNKNESILVEIPNLEDFKEIRKKSKFGKLIKDTDYGEMSIENKFVNDSYVFIERRTKESKHQFTIVYKGEHLGVWVDVEKGLMYLSSDFDPHSKRKYAMLSDDLDEGIQLVVGYSKNMFMTKFKSAFKHGLLRFDNQKLRTYGYEILKMLNYK